MAVDVLGNVPGFCEGLVGSRQALSFASQYDEITDEEKAIIIQAKKSFESSKSSKSSTKTRRGVRNRPTHFDVTMGSFDGAETCELVGFYLLSKLTPECKSNVGLYRDDGLAALNKTPKEIESIKKHICKIFNDHNPKLTIEANKKCVDYLDITLDLRSGTYKPFTKPGNIPQYVNRHSNHPPSILRSIPEAINRRLTNISSDKQSFDAAIPPYQEALKKSGYDFQLNYNPQRRQCKRPRSRNILWFNPPYSVNVATNVGKKFLEAIDECFPKNNPLNKIFNRNTMKLSYSCMPNISSIISSHNKSVLTKEAERNPVTNTQDCNCRKKETCHYQENA